MKRGPLNREFQLSEGQGLVGSHFVVRYFDPKVQLPTLGDVKVPLL
jgi:hypothetical protein